MKPAGMVIDRLSTSLRPVCVCSVALVTMLVATDAAGQVVARKIGPSSGEKGPKLIGLVNSDDELTGFLDQARKLIADGDYSQGISILHALILREDSGFAPGSANRQYSSLWLKANELLASMPPVALRRYRALYDPQARKLYDQALATNNASLLQQLVRRYLNTSFGARGLKALAAIHFDRGRFFSAARCWTRSLRSGGDSVERAVTLAKIASAYHLAGNRAMAEEYAARLSREGHDAQAVLAGKRQKVTDFLAVIMAMSPAVTQAPTGVSAGWSGLAGAPDGMTVMEDSDAVLVPRWRSPSALGRSTLKLPHDLIAMKAQFAAFSNTRTGQSVSGKLKDGRVILRAKMRNTGVDGRNAICPPVVHPVIIDNMVLCRTSKALEAYDGLTGEKLWDTEEFFPLHRPMATSDDLHHFGSFYYYGSFQIGDRGWQTVTVGGGMAFALGNFRDPGTAQIANMGGMNTNAAQLADTSCLAAFSLERGGRSVWRVGYGAGGSSELLRGCKFIAAPTYHGGRLYGVVTFRMSCYAICLEADSGRLVWQSLVSQLPSVSQNRYGYQTDHLLERGSSPAVADGQVILLTNAGVIAALDAESGQGIWAYEYDSTTTDYTRNRYSSGSSAFQVFYPPNPVIVSRGRVICLPADSKEVLSLSAESGALIWQVDRRRQRNLSAIDDERILLSGNGLVVLSTENSGKALHESMGKGIVGRPAVTSTRILASVKGGLFGLKLDGYGFETFRLGSADGVLGNLVSFSGKLVAANVLGICGYFEYDKARQLLTDRMLASEADDRPGALFQRGQLAFNAARFSQALEDLTDASTEAMKRGIEQLPLSIRPWIYRTHVALANSADSNEKMLSEFKQAEQLAATDQERAHTLLRMAKYYERIGQYPDSVDRFQELSETYGDEPLVDVNIGASADNAVRFGEDVKRTTGKVLAQAAIGRLIKLHGRGVYAKLDDLAYKALTDAIVTEDTDAMMALVQRWRHSSSADHALMEAGEISYRRALSLHQRSKALVRQAGAKGPDADKLSSQAKELAADADNLFNRSLGMLAELATRHDSPLRLKANVGLGAIYARRGHVTTVGLKCDEIRHLCEQSGEFSLQMQVTFGEYSGRVQDVLKRLESGNYSDGVSPSIVSALNLPLGKVFTFADQQAVILRDQHYRALQIDTHVFLLRGTDLVMLNTAASDDDSAVRWVSPVRLNVKDMEGSVYTPGWRIVAGLSDDSKLLVVADVSSVVALDVRTGKSVWQKSMGDLGVTNVSGMSTGSDLLVLRQSTGRLTAVDMFTGDVLWRSSSPKHESLANPPRIGAGVVINASKVNGGGFAVRAYNARTGKLVARWTDSIYCYDIRITPKGLVVLLLGDELVVYEAAKLKGPPIWKRELPKDGYGTILAASNNRVAISPDRKSSNIEVLSLTDNGRVLALLETSRIDGLAALPMDAWFNADTLVVACAASTPVLRRQSSQSYVNDMSLHGFDLSKELSQSAMLSAAWSRQLVARSNVNGRILPAAIARDHVVAFHKAYSSGVAMHAFVVNVHSGKVADKIDLIGNVDDIRARTASQRRIGPPVVSGGRVCVETCEGVTVYGGQ